MRDIWSYLDEAAGICITTNGNIKANGENIMGGGLAHQAATRYPDLPARLGAALAIGGNRVYRFAVPDTSTYIITMPTKEDVRNPSTMERVAQSTHELEWFRQVGLLDTAGGTRPIVIPQAGCGLGGLSWDGPTGVKGVILTILNEHRNHYVLLDDDVQ